MQAKLIRDRQNNKHNPNKGVFIRINGLLGYDNLNSNLKLVWVDYLG